MIKSALINFILLGLLFGAPFFAIAQNEGIRFENNLSWQEVQAKASAENKYIFMECFATWCGPCKWMADNIFPKNEVGRFFNSNFVCVRVQMDESKGDNEHIKSWYSNASEIGKKYAIDEYPSFLFFSPDGSLVHKIIGTIQNAHDFVEKAKEALEPSHQYYTRMHHWREHASDTLYLWNAYSEAIKIRDRIRADSIAEAYLNMQTDLFTVRNLNLIASPDLINSAQGRWFRFLQFNAPRIDSIMQDSGKTSAFVERMLRSTVAKDELSIFFYKNEPVYWRAISEDIKQKYPQLNNEFQTLIKKAFQFKISQKIDSFAKNAGSNYPDWKQIGIIMHRKYPDFDISRLLLVREGTYDEKKGLWTDCGKTAFTLMRYYCSQIDEYEMNNIAWFWVFAHCDDKTTLNEAIKQMKGIIRISERLDYLDTYANLLYKKGEKKKAVSYERRIVEEANKMHLGGRDLKGYEVNLSNMEKGIPTWGDNVVVS